MTDYQRIEKAIGFISNHFKEQPDLDEVARQVYLSPFHFQRLFSNWAGVSPKKFLQYISVEYAKELLEKKYTIADASEETGLSGTSRLHDLFIHIEGMTPGEYKNEGENLVINYSYADTVFGMVLIASTQKGVCHISFTTDADNDLQELYKRFSRAVFIQQDDQLQKNALRVFNSDWNDLPRVKLHLKGTSFQLKVWEALLKIPSGSMNTYSGIAGLINEPRSARAVGTAVGQNPVAFLIPCHRVIRATGKIGEYHWGSVRKTAILGWEAARRTRENQQLEPMPG